MIDESAAAQRVGPSRGQLDNAPALQITKVFERGADGDDAVTFAQLLGVALTDTGDVLALDRGLNNYRMFDSAGKLLRTIGHIGDGHGEFKYPDTILLANDTIYILDIRAINRFTLDGGYIDRLVIDNMTAQRSKTHAQFLSHAANGLVVVLPEPYHGAATGEAYRDTVALQMLDGRTGKPGPPVLNIVSEERRMIGGLQYVDRNGPITQYAVGNNTAFVTSQDGASVFRVPLDGSPQSRITLEGKPRRVDPSAHRRLVRGVDSVLRMQAAAHPEGEAQSTVKVDEIIRFFKEAPHSDVITPVGRLVVSDSGALLVERRDLSRGAALDPGPTIWNLLSAEGGLVGELTFPARFKPMALKNNRIAGVQKDSLDVQSLVVYSIKGKLANRR